MKRCRAVIVGAGASGLAAALAASQGGGGVVLVEGSSKPGKKLLATGNGRCNLTNRHIAPEYYHGDAALAAPLLARWPGERVVRMFHKLGLLTRTDGEGRVYPRGLQAAAVLQALWSACEATGVEMLWNFRVERAWVQGEGFCLAGGEGQGLFASRLVLACGGKASPKHSTGSGYELARGFGHSVTGLSPSLVGLAVPERLTRPLKGMRCKARAALCQGGRELGAESGEVIFGQGSLSGICVMNLSARLRGLAGDSLSLRLDLAEELEAGELEAFLRAQCASFPERPASGLFAGVMNLLVGQELVQSLGWGGRRFSQLSREDLRRAAALAKGFALPVSGPLGWDQAQVTAGGVPLGEVDVNTMESRCRKGLYLTGELLDLDGDCGGYNLHWAWATGLTAGESIGRKGGREA